MSIYKVIQRKILALGEYGYLIQGQSIRIECSRRSPGPGRMCRMKGFLGKILLLIGATVKHETNSNFHF